MAVGEREEAPGPLGIVDSAAHGGSERRRGMLLKLVFGDVWQ